MNPYQEAVEDFHNAGEATIGETPELRDRELRAKLIMEEAIETVAAMGYAATGWFSEPYGPDDYQPDAIFTTFKSIPEPDFVEVIDGLCDLLYVTFGTAVAAGIDLDPFFAEVHRSNMDKYRYGKILREDGKILKPEGWKPPQLEPILAQVKAYAEMWRAAWAQAEAEAGDYSEVIGPYSTADIDATVSAESGHERGR